MSVSHFLESDWTKIEDKSPIFLPYFPGRETDCNFYMSSYAMNLVDTNMSSTLMHIKSFKTLILSHLNFVSALGIMFVSHICFYNGLSVLQNAKLNHQKRLFRGEPFCSCIKLSIIIKTRFLSIQIQSQIFSENVSNAETTATSGDLNRVVNLVSQKHKKLFRSINEDIFVTLLKVSHSVCLF